jgi:hypothetical protein
MLSLGLDVTVTIRCREVIPCEPLGEWQPLATRYGVSPLLERAHDVIPRAPDLAVLNPADRRLGKPSGRRDLFLSRVHLGLLSEGKKVHDRTMQ